MDFSARVGDSSLSATLSAEKVCCITDVQGVNTIHGCSRRQFCFHISFLARPVVLQKNCEIGVFWLVNQCQVCKLTACICIADFASDEGCATLSCFGMLLGHQNCVLTQHVRTFVRFRHVGKSIVIVFKWWAGLAPQFVSKIIEMISRCMTPAFFLVLFWRFLRPTLVLQ